MLEQSPVTRKQLEAAVEEYKKSQSDESHMVVKKWLNQEVEKRLETENYEELVETHMETAKMLQKLGMYKDAQDMWQGILIMAHDAGDAKVVGEAMNALDEIPTLH